MKKRPSTLRDANQIAKSIVDLATAEEPVIEAESEPAIVTRARKGGVKGGPARAAKLTAEERSAIAKAAADKRWKTHSQDIQDGREDSAKGL